MKIIPYLLVKNGLEAIELYKNIFKAELTEHQKFSPEIGKQMGFPNDFNYENSTMHAKLNFFNEWVYLADSAEVQDEKSFRNVEVLLELDNKADIDEIIKKAKESNFTFLMEYEKTFWGAWFARFKDTMGINWQVNFQEPNKS